MATRYVPVPVSGGGSAAGILLLLVAIVGLLALFTGNLDRALRAIAGPAGGPSGLGGSVTAPGGAGIGTGTYGQPVAAAGNRPAGQGGARAT